MKLRIYADSIRLRLKQSEVKTLVEGGEVVENCPTTPVPLSYALRPDAAASGLKAHSDGTRLTVEIPASWLTGWDTDERVGFESAEGLHILIEKDFKCTLPASPKDNEDCYENPVNCG
jgi:hypothetical protein